MEKLKQIMTCAAVAALLPLGLHAGDGVKAEFLGGNNTLVRVTGEGRYLLLPVQENRDDAKINVLVDNETVKTLYVRLAGTGTDYTVPLDLSPYKGKKVSLLIETPEGHGQGLHECKSEVKD